MQCPICAQTLDGGELVMVCASCHRTLGGGLSVGKTGEFRVPSPEAFAAAGVAPGERPSADNMCSWCGKSEPQVSKVLGRGGVALCNECVALACDILDAELGGSWRS